MSDGLSIYAAISRGDFIDYLRKWDLKWTSQNFVLFARSRESEALDYLFNAIAGDDIYEDEDSLQQIFEDMQEPDSRSPLLEN